VALVRPSPAVTAEVETVSMAPTQPEGDASNDGTPEPREVWVESWTPGPHVARIEAWVLRRVRLKLWASRGAWRKSMRQPTMGPRGVGRSYRLGGSWTASLCSQGGLTTQTHGLTASLYSGNDRIARERGLTASSGQQ
jgi:hypothetical protein